MTLLLDSPVPAPCFINETPGPSLLFQRNPSLPSVVSFLFRPLTLSHSPVAQTSSRIPFRRLLLGG